MNTYYFKLNSKTTVAVKASCLKEKETEHIISFLKTIQTVPEFKNARLATETEINNFKE